MNYPYRSHYQYEAVPNRRRVVVTGVGAVSAAGVGAKALWDALIEGRTCIDVFECAGPAVAELGVAGAVKNWDAQRHISPKQRPQRMARLTQFAVVAAQEALKDAGYSPESVAEKRVAVVLGSALGTTREVELLVREFYDTNPNSVTPRTMATQNFQAASIAVAELLGVPAASVTSLTNNCASGVDAISQGVDLIRFGRYDLVVCGGSEAPLTAALSTVMKAAGMAIKWLSPHDASRPFDRERACGILGEGAGVVVLEAATSAADRGASPYIEICGFSSFPDEQRDRPSSGLEVTMKGALDNAGCSVRDIDFISAWGCGHPLLDRCETEAIKNVFGEEAYRLAVGSIKGVIGIPLGAAGALQLVALALSHRHQLLPPTANWQHGDIDCDLDYIRGQPRRVRLRKTLLNAHGMSGANISLVASGPV